VNQSVLLRSIVAIGVCVVPGIFSPRWALSALASCGTHTCSIYTDNTQQQIAVSSLHVRCEIISPAAARLLPPAVVSYRRPADLARTTQAI
jgi:hypothetical protein